MATFYIKTNDEFAYSKITESVAERGLTHCKTNTFGTTEFEIMGSPDDFKFFEFEISQLNALRGYAVALITEGV